MLLLFKKAMHKHWTTKVQDVTAFWACPQKARKLKYLGIHASAFTVRQKI